MAIRRPGCPPWSMVEIPVHQRRRVPVWQMRTGISGFRSVIRNERTKALIKFEMIGTGSLTVCFDGEDILISGNRDGLRSLSKTLLMFSDQMVSVGSHIHLEPGLQLSESSISLVIDLYE